LTLVGALGAGAQLTLTESLRAAPASTSAPFEYSSLIFATLIGWFAFGEWPAPNTLVGSALLISAGLAVIWHERRLMLRL
jgi:drug/metabolite transporter (DMT)-like permease